MKNLEKILQKYYKVVLIVIFFIALGLRWLYLPQNAISFAFDQARDAFLVQDLLKGDLKLLGPSVSGVPGLYHGVLYYYVIASAYLLGNGNPVIVAYFLSFISSLVVFLVYFLAFNLTKKFTPAVLSALIFAFSFESSQYANLLTNASMGVWFVPLTYIAILIRSPILLGLSFGLAVQSEVALLYHIIPIIILLHKKFLLKQILLAIGMFLVAVSTMIVSEMKFGFSGVRGLFYIFSGTDAISNSKVLSDYLTTVINQSSLTFSYSIYPLNTVLGGLLGFSMILYALRSKSYWSKFLFIYIFAYALALPFGGWNMKHILVGASPAVASLTGIFIWKYLNGNKIIFTVSILLVLISNLYMILTKNINGQTIFPLQQDLVLSKEIAVLDYTYQKSEKMEFSISTLTSPLFVNTLWSYLYNWYGKSHNGYVPSFIGQDQVDLLGDNLVKSQKDEFRHFYIEEPTYGIPSIYVEYARGDKDSFSELVEEKNFGELRVEERNYIK